jgi:hypothetical protein
VELTVFVQIDIVELQDVTDSLNAQVLRDCARLYHFQMVLVDLFVLGVEEPLAVKDLEYWIEKLPLWQKVVNILRSHR